ncbi:MAG: cytochrome-c peroxidase [Saprospiraceae bacterium]
MKNIFLASIFLGLLLIVACSPDPQPPIDPTTIYDDDPLTSIAYNPTSYTFQVPQGFPNPIIPADNPMTAEGIELGRKLFYDPILSGDSTMSCEGCHKQAFAFADELAVNVGIDGVVGTRNPPPLFNLAFVANGLNWDASAITLEEQAIIPITSPIELHESLENVTFKLKRHSQYPTWFREAFGIEKKGEITDELARKALAQFIRTMVTSESKWDRSLGLVPNAPRPFLTDSEQRGNILFNSENQYVASSTGQIDSLVDKECLHCHKGGRLFTNNAFVNNGLTETQNLLNFPDLGLGAINGNISDNGKFRTPSLRNIELTAPYMHDGRFATLEEVIDHYGEHLKESPNIDGILGARINNPTVAPIRFTQQEKEDIINYMKTLTDTAFINNPAFSNPW